MGVKPKATIYVDMDGTIANIHAMPNWWDEVKTDPDFFKKLEPFQNLITALFLTQICYGNKLRMCSLSSVDETFKNVYSTAKDYWMDENAYFITERIYATNGRRKSEAVGRKLSKNDILLDDYSKNLNEWIEDGGTGIKIRNPINCVNGNWKGEIICNQDFTNIIIKKLDSILMQFM